MSSNLERLLGTPLVRAIDTYFSLFDEWGAAVTAGETERAHTLWVPLREAKAAYLALVVERLDSRNAAMLLDMHKRVDSLEILFRRSGDDVDDPTGFDAGRQGA